MKLRGSSPLKVKAIDNLKYENFTDSDKRAVAWKFFSNLEVKFLIHTLLEKWLIIIKLNRKDVFAKADFKDYFQQTITYLCA